MKLESPTFMRDHREGWAGCLVRIDGVFRKVCSVPLGKEQVVPPLKDDLISVINSNTKDGTTDWEMVQADFQVIVDKNGADGPAGPKFKFL